MNEKLTKQLLEESSQLPAEQLQEVIDFTEFLLCRRAATGSPNGGLGHALNRFIGGVSHGSLARRIDDELYGPTVR